MLSPAARRCRRLLAATIALLNCCPKKSQPGQELPQPGAPQLPPIALAEVLLELALRDASGVTRRLLQVGKPKLERGCQNGNAQRLAYSPTCTGNNVAHALEHGIRSTTSTSTAAASTIEHHIAAILAKVEPTNLGASMAQATRGLDDAEVIPQIDLENACGRWRRD